MLSEYFTERDAAAREMAEREPKKFLGVMISAGGSIGRARELLSPTAAAENEEARESVVKILTALSATGSQLQLHRTIASLPKSRAELKPIFESIILAIRDLTAIKHDAGAALIFFTDRAEAAELSARLNQKKLLSVYDVMCSLIEDIDRNANVTAMLTSLAVKIKNC